MKHQTYKKVWTAWALRMVPETRLRIYKVSENSLQSVGILKKGQQPFDYSLLNC